ncbi:MAG: ASKHA domain-containing protein [Roseburia intestinalis]
MNSCGTILLILKGILGEPWFEKGFPVVPGKIYFTQEDIRQVQMAKAAICAGLEVLLQKSNISHEQIKKSICCRRVWHGT